MNLSDLHIESTCAFIPVQSKGFEFPFPLEGDGKTVTFLPFSVDCLWC